MKQATTEEVRSFWESHPLFVGELSHPPGSREFFEEYRQIMIQDCFAGSVDESLFPQGGNRARVLDLGCGPGFWTIELAHRGCEELTAADLTERALELARKNCSLHGVRATFAREDAQALSFPDETFTHVNCSGVIHHTPSPERCIGEIARVLKPGGTASISVYFRNPIVAAWPWLKLPRRTVAWLGGGLRGRGRESMLQTDSAEELVRMYDGAENPIGVCYSEREFRELLSPVFEVREFRLHYFPARALPVGIPAALHRLLDRQLGFLLHANVVRGS